MKKVTIIVLAVILIFSLCACNDEGYNRAIIHFPNGEIIEGDVKSYFASSNSISVEFTNGAKYRTGSMNIILIKDGTH